MNFSLKSFKGNFSLRRSLWCFWWNFARKQSKSVGRDEWGTTCNFQIANGPVVRAFIYESGDTIHVLTLSNAELGFNSFSPSQSQVMLFPLDYCLRFLTTKWKVMASSWFSMKTFLKARIFSSGWQPFHCGLLANIFHCETAVKEKIRTSNCSVSTHSERKATRFPTEEKEEEDT